MKLKEFVARLCGVLFPSVLVPSLLESGKRKMKRIVSRTMLTLILISVLTLASNVHLSKAIIVLNDCLTTQKIGLASTGRSAAFIYSTDPSGAQSYESLLEANGIAVDLVPNSTAATWNYSTYELIIIGQDTGLSDQWEPESAVPVINGTGKPILGLGWGGSCFFSKLGLYIDWGQGWLGPADSIYVVDSAHRIFHFPNEIAIPANGSIQLYTVSSHIGIYMPSPVAGVTPLGREPADANHYSLIQEDTRYVLWGFTNPPTYMTQTGKDLFVNLVLWLINWHNLALTGMVTPSSCTAGDAIPVNVTVKNDGDFTEDFNLTLYYNSTKIETKLITLLSSNSSKIVSFNWNTTGVQPGNYQIRAVIEPVPQEALTTDNEGSSQITVNAPSAPPSGIPLELLIAIAAAAAVVVAVVIYLKRRPKKPKKVIPPKPPNLKLSVDPKEILADGKSTSTITIELVDDTGSPLPCLADTQISLFTTSGKITGSVKVPKDDYVVSTTLTSSPTVGTAAVTARSEGMKEARTDVVFAEKPRYCMHCGAKISYADKRCPKCGRAPPAGVDTKVCKNCESVIPVVAKFCSECGASQPE